MSDEEFAAVPRPIFTMRGRMSQKQWMEATTLSRPGAHYGLEFPCGFGELRLAGAEWLTQALHAAGTLPWDNSVVEMKVTKLSEDAEAQDSMGGSGMKGLLTVEYAKPHPELHTRLFVKMPFPYAPENERMRNSYNGIGDEGEILFLRLLAPLMPFPSPKYYYGDISYETTNYILIEEQVPYKQTTWLEAGKDAKFGPYEVEPRIIKFKEYELPNDGADYYYALMKAIAQMVCAAHKGELGDRGRLAEVFPVQLPVPTKFCLHGWPAARAAMSQAGGRLPLEPGEAQGWKAANENQVMVVDGMFCQLVNFIQNAPHLFPKELTQATFLKKYRQEAMEIAHHFMEIQTYLNINPEFWAVIHPNLPSDNAYYWRDEAGELLAGLLDYGGAGTMNVAAMWNMSFIMCEEGMLRKHEKGLLQYFVDEVRKGGGPESITFDEVMYQVKLSQGIFSAQAGGVVMQLLKNHSKDVWKEMSGRWDRRINERFSNRNYVCSITNNLACWKHRKVYDHFVKWWKANKSWFPDVDRKSFKMPALSIKL